MQSICKKTCNLCEYSRTEEIVEHDENKKEPELEVVDAEEENENAEKEYSESGTNTDQVNEEDTIETTTILSTNILHFTVKSEKQTIFYLMKIYEIILGKRYLCSEQTYAYLMNKQCPKTCGVCQLSHRPDQQCQDRAPNCNKSLCDRQTYHQLMRSICKRTCSLC
ncbi:unnamed protein product [Onchocerca flexuosa]|uniref:ShTK domain protein n=1 Tax=Onchocerca flexuosa TaxID=387005 RepID=A0A183GZX6_9BILA|nr:unnamed protein product [Onchocerca flexuosa]